MNSNLIEINHPLVQHKLSMMRMRETPHWQFRILLKEISMLLAYEVTRDMETVEVDLETPVAKTKGKVLREKDIVLVPIMRAGNGILDGMLQVLPTALVGHIGLYREPSTFVTVEYYFKLPDAVSNRHMIVLDPMLATGNSAAAAVHRLKECKPKSIKFVSIVASPEGVQLLHEEHPDLKIYTAALDQGLNDKGYIVPGFGDAGDRLFGTKL